MPTILEISSTKYDDDIPLIKKALINLEYICEIRDGFLISEPMARFGWTFFKIAIKPNLFFAIEKKFQDMINNSKGRKPEDRFSNFMSDYFSARGCAVKIKLFDY